MTGSFHVPEALRARLADDYRPVRRLPPPMARVAWLLPFAVLALLAAPTAFHMRPDAARLGLAGTWGASALQVIVGFGLIVAALRESIPGRPWSRLSLSLWLTLPLAVVVLVTIASWEASPVVLDRGWWMIGLICLTGALASALPVVALASVLAARAYPTRPALAGALLGLGAGLMADAGWRLFCHFSEPAHVLSAHLGAVVIAALLGSALATAICRAQRRSWARCLSRPSSGTR